MAYYIYHIHYVYIYIYIYNCYINIYIYIFIYKYIFIFIYIQYIYIFIQYIYIFIYIFIYIYLYIFFSISNDPKCPIGRAYIQTVMDERITLCNYTTQSFMFYTFVRCPFLFYLKKTRAKLLLNSIWYFSIRVVFE